MEFVAKKGEVIVMDESDTYLVLKTIEYEGVGYLHMIQTGEYLYDEHFEIDSSKEAYAKEVITDEEDYFLEFINDEELIKKLSAVK